MVYRDFLDIVSTITRYHLIHASMSDHTLESNSKSQDELRYVQYDPSQEDKQLPIIRELISKDLSEPYSIYVYRYFLYQWGDLCYMV